MDEALGTAEHKEQHDHGRDKLGFQRGTHLAGAVLRARDRQEDGRIANSFEDDKIDDQGGDEAFDYGLFL